MKSQTSNLHRYYLLASAVLMVLSTLALNALAATTTPPTMNYQGRLLNSSSVALTGTYRFRFSLWWDAGDATGAGAIDVASAGYADWQEAQTVATDSFGLFNIAVGSVTPLPDFDFSVHKYLQVEVKLSTDPDTAYEVLDPSGTVADLTDRRSVQNQAYSTNADSVDNATVGTAAGELATLSAGGVWSRSQIPGGTDADSFVLDYNDSAAGAVTLQFGTTLAKTLKYIPASSWFEFNDDVNIAGDLTVTGTINGVTVGLTNQTITLDPEYSGAVLQADGAGNAGKLEIFYEDTDGAGGNNNNNYYLWTTQQAALQDMDLVIRFTLPSNFSSWQATPIEFKYKTNDGVAANNSLTLTAEDSAGTSVALTGASSLASAAWATSSITFGGAPTWTAGQTITLKVKLAATSVGSAFAGQLKFNFVGN